MTVVVPTEPADVTPMRENPDHEPEPIDRPAPEPSDSRRSTDLKAIVVRYGNRPDRCTIAPRECTGGERLTAWLSADLDSFADLEENR